MLSKLETFSSFSAAEKRLFIRAWFMLAWYRVLLGLRGFKRSTSHLVHSSTPAEAQKLSNSQSREAQAIGHMVALASRYAPWDARCLHQAMVAQRLASERGISGQIFLGVEFRRAMRNSENPLSAHAWVQCGGHIILGGEGHRWCTVISSYSWE